MTPQELKNSILLRAIQGYQEERASLNAEIDRVLADISTLLGGITNG